MWIISYNNLVFKYKINVKIKKVKELENYYAFFDFYNS